MGGGECPRDKDLYRKSNQKCGLDANTCEFFLLHSPKAHEKHFPLGPGKFTT